MANNNWPPDGDEPIDLLDEDLLEEADLQMDDDDGGFEEESTQIYQPDEHDDPGGFEEEATRVFDPNDGDPGEFEDESTRVWQHEPDPAPAPVAAAARGGAYTTQLPRHGVTELAGARSAVAQQMPEESTIITDSTALYPPETSRKQVAKPTTAAAPGRVPASGQQSRSKAVPILIGVAVLALLSTLAAVLFGSSAPATGTVAVLTTPPGASVVLDGEQLTLTTPTTLSDLEVGRSYTLSLSLEGYQTATDTLIIDEGVSQETYEMDPATGSIVVRTVPEGASITVDGTIRGSSPVTVDGLDPTMPHEVIATMTGHDDVTRTVTFAADGPREELVTMTLIAAVAAVPAAATQLLLDAAGNPVLDASGQPVMVPVPAAGQALAANGQPAASAVGLDGQPLAAGAVPAAGQAAPAVTVGPNGELIGPDGQPILGPDGQPLTVVAGNTAEEPAEEPAVPAASSSSRSSDSSSSSRSSSDSSRSSRSSSDSSRSSRSTDTSRSSRSSRSSDPGSSRATAGSSRDRPSSRTSRSSLPSRERPSRATQRPEPEPEPEPAGDGSLSVQAVPYGQVWIDGRMVAPETPLIGHDLSAGVHRVKVYFVGLRTFSDERSVRIEADENRTITFRAER